MIFISCIPSPKMPFNIHISINGPIYAFSTICIKILPASTHYQIPKPLSYIKIFVTAIAHFPVLKSVLDSCGCYNELSQTWWFKVVFSSCFTDQSPKLSYVGYAPFGGSKEKSVPFIYLFFCGCHHSMTCDCISFCSVFTSSSL